MKTGTVSRVQTLKGWLVMVRDSKNTHPGNKLWGDGWGWSWFDAGNPTKTTSTDYKVNCLGCHVPALLDAVGIAYTGCSTSALFETLSKVETKLTLAHAGLPTPEWSTDGSSIESPLWVISGHSTC